MALIYPQNDDLTKSLKSARKKVPQSARLSAGGAVKKAIRAMPKCLRVNLSGASLRKIEIEKNSKSDPYQEDSEASPTLSKCLGRTTCPQ